MKEDARRIFRSAIRAVDPGGAVKCHCVLSGDRLRVANRDYDLTEYNGIYVVGAGKGSAAMARALEDILGDKITAGIVATKYGYREELKHIELMEGGHPIPDAGGERATRAMVELVEDTDQGDLVFCLISGGGSALTPYPVEGISLEDKGRTTKLLLECGATIDELNAVRKHLSRFKGGQLARWIYPATTVTLILSDVIGDKLDVIASGPTVGDGSTFADAYRILEKYDLLRKIPRSALSYIERGLAGDVPETPKPGDSIFRQVQNAIVGNNRLALEAAKEEAERLGYFPVILSSEIAGEARDVARELMARAKGISGGGKKCLIAGGETTVTVRGNGKGGRNQELTLAAAIEIEGMENIAVLSGGTDGTDGPTDAAGAVADGETAPRARALGMDPQDYLDRNDSYHFFQRLGDLIVTGPTNTNVMDIIITLVK
ncbi:MAG: glycerate kinase type-2 family protein [bacterium]